jgi:hypothetical protein
VPCVSLKIFRQCFDEKFALDFAIPLVGHVGLSVINAQRPRLNTQHSLGSVSKFDVGR